jgi:hypothetical protein
MTLFLQNKTRKISRGGSGKGKGVPRPSPKPYPSSEERSSKKSTVTKSKSSSANKKPTAKELQDAELLLTMVREAEKKAEEAAKKAAAAHRYAPRGRVLSGVAAAAAAAKAEAEAAKKAEEAEAKRKAEAEAAKKAEEAEAKRKAEAEAKRKAEAEAQRKAKEAEAQRKAEAEAQRKAAEAQRKAEEAATKKALANAIEKQRKEDSATLAEVGNSLMNDLEKEEEDLKTQWRTDEQLNEKHSKRERNPGGKILVFDLDETITGNSDYLLTKENHPETGEFVYRYKILNEKRQPKYPPTINKFVSQFLADVCIDLQKNIDAGTPEKAKVSSILILSNNSIREYVDLSIKVLYAHILYFAKQKGVTITLKYEEIFDLILYRTHRFRTGPRLRDTSYKVKSKKEVEKALEYLKIPQENLEKRIIFFDDLPDHKLAGELENPENQFVNVITFQKIGTKLERVKLQNGTEVDSGYFDVDKVKKFIGL